MSNWHILIKFVGTNSCGTFAERIENPKSADCEHIKINFIKMPKTVVIVQARFSSSRLPGKILLPLPAPRFKRNQSLKLGKEELPVLVHLVERARGARSIDLIVVATSTHVTDDPVEELCQMFGYECFRGDLNDVLKRFTQCANRYDADVILRLTGDNPLADPWVIEEALEDFTQGRYDYFAVAANLEKYNGDSMTVVKKRNDDEDKGLESEEKNNGVPNGLEVEIMSREVLVFMDGNAVRKVDREHVTTYVRTGRYLQENQGERWKTWKTGTTARFLNRNIGRNRWTLDYEQDYQLLYFIFEKLWNPDYIFRYQQVLDLKAQYPEKFELNSEYIRDEGYRKSMVTEENLNITKSP